MKDLINKKVLQSFFYLFLFTVTATMAQTNSIAIVDAKYSQKQQVLDNLPSNTEVLEIDGNGNPWKSIREHLENNRSTVAVHLFVNASYNAFELGNTTYDSDAVDQEFELSMLEGLYQGDHIQLIVYDCNLGSNTEGLALLKKISDKSYFNIAVPTNCSSVFGSNLKFDHTTMNQPTQNSIFQ
ncbi:DUF4347 domain-containing protein [Flagellimonas alvinocaridis]|uniref:DUF4347 domain-containing protein n=1 Tax=Flagellimonas alvinocaridis TaxID=2530200 RepID=A0A4S8RI47_9FLAO|nr:DUF4347 domain-containing protein [Allomuricauda alvinocaridis]THV58063.1 DUF4347 domain-containing protein [Allomuricauda alvinocaridis]